MAHYLVTAKPRRARMAELEQRLREGAFVSLQPFGRAMTVALEKARVVDDGRAAWEEEDYCSPPLAEERVAALDQYFDDIEVTSVEPGDGWCRIADRPRLFPELPARE